MVILMDASLKLNEPENCANQSPVYQVKGREIKMPTTLISAKGI